MRWQGRRQSDNVEDRRGMPRGGWPWAAGWAPGRARGGRPCWAATRRPCCSNCRRPAADPAAGPRQVDPAEQPLKDFVSVVLADTEDVWNELFGKQLRRQYREPKLVLYTGQVQIGLRLGQRGDGAFLLPGGRKGLSGPEFLRGNEDEVPRSGRFRGRLRAWRTRSATTCRSCSASWIWSTSSEDGSARPSRTACLCVWSCRPTIWPASGRTTPRGRKKSSSPATWTRPCGRPAPWVTTGCRSRPRATSSRIPSRTAPPRQRSRWFRLGLQTGDFQRAKELFDLPEEQL